MKLLIALILIIVNFCYNINAKNTQTFANFQGSYNSDSCDQGTPKSIGYSIAIGQCFSMYGIYSYVVNSMPETTNWIFSLDNNKDLIVKQYDTQDENCKYSVINQYTIPQSSACVETPSFLNVNNSLLETNNTNQFSKFSISTGKPTYSPNSIVFSQYNTPSTLCIYNNQQFSVTYPSGSTVVEGATTKIVVLCNQVDQSMMFKCQKEDSNCGSNGGTFIDTTCQTSGDVTIYCNGNN